MLNIGSGTEAIAAFVEFREDDVLYKENILYY